MNQNVIQSISGADLNVTEMIDPTTIRFRAQQMSDQINNSRSKFAAAQKAPQKRIRDLTDWISDIIIETTVQGSSLIEVHVIDPVWTLFQRDSDGTSFIDVDDQGFLWPPVEVTYPEDISDSTWRLAQVRPSTDLNQPNVVLTFEDKVASELREHFGQVSSNANETRAEFIERLISMANKQPEFPTDVKIRFRALLPQETFQQSDLSLTNTPPASARQQNPPPARAAPLKLPAASAFPPLDQAPVSNPIGRDLQKVDISIQDTWDAVGTLFGKTPYQPVTLPPASVFPPFDRAP